MVDVPKRAKRARATGAGRGYRRRRALARRRLLPLNPEVRNRLRVEVDRARRVELEHEADRLLFAGR